MHDQVDIDRLAVLVRDQHVVHQRHRQVGRHQRRGGRGQRQQEAGQQLALVGLGKTPQAEQGPGRRRCSYFARADRALFLVRRQRSIEYPLAFGTKKDIGAGGGSPVSCWLSC